MNLQERLVAFSEHGEHDGSHDRSKPDTPHTVWGGCHRFSLPVVQSVLSRIADKNDLALMHVKGNDLAFIVSAACLVRMRDLPFSEYVNIIQTAAEKDFQFRTVEWYRKRHDRAGFLINMPYSETVRHTVENLAKAIVWIEALTFLEAEGYNVKTLPRAA